MSLENISIDIDKIVADTVEECRNENGIFNLVIRDDVFKILEQQCYVVYFPLKNEDINGFHIMRTVNGQKKHFVYINTANTTERQIFTAAHELGHIWNVYAKIKNKYPDFYSYVSEIGESVAEENIVNKFAAQLLMPADIFKKEITKELQVLDYNGKSISKINFLRLTVSLMNTFFVGYKATTRRFLEIGRIDKKTYNTIKEFENDKDFQDIFQNILKEGDYKRLDKRSESKNITNLTDLIREAETKSCDLDNTIERLKKEFDVPSMTFSKQDDQVLFDGSVDFN